MISALRKQTPAFTRFELLACLGAIALFGTIILPALARSGSRGDRVVCFNNLRQIGVAYGQFGLEHGDLVPWRLSTVEGGNMDHPGRNNLHIQFSVLSNALATPKVLSDPGDARLGLRPATHWGTTSGGLLHPSFGNNSVSYFLGIEANFRVPTSVLAGDRNVQAIPMTGSSSSVFPLFAQVVTPGPWTNDVHGLSGNIVLIDGSAAQVDSKGLEDAIKGAYRSAPGDVQPPRLRVLIP